MRKQPCGVYIDNETMAKMLSAAAYAARHHGETIVISKKTATNLISFFRDIAKYHPNLDTRDWMIYEAYNISLQLCVI